MKSLAYNTVLLGPLPSTLTILDVLPLSARGKHQSIQHYQETFLFYPSLPSTLKDCCDASHSRLYKSGLSLRRQIQRLKQ
jgi:hypothetical protein